MSQTQNMMAILFKPEALDDPYLTDVVNINVIDKMVNATTCPKHYDKCEYLCQFLDDKQNKLEDLLNDIIQIELNNPNKIYIYSAQGGQFSLLFSLMTKLNRRRSNSIKSQVYIREKYCSGNPGNIWIPGQPDNGSDFSNCFLVGNGTLFNNMKWFGESTFIALLGGITIGKFALRRYKEIVKQFLTDFFNEYDDETVNSYTNFIVALSYFYKNKSSLLQVGIDTNIANDVLFGSTAGGGSLDNFSNGIYRQFEYNPIDYFNKLKYSPKNIQLMLDESTIYNNIDKVEKWYGEEYDSNDITLRNMPEFRLFLDKNLIENDKITIIQHDWDINSKCSDINKDILKI